MTSKDRLKNALESCQTMTVIADCMEIEMSNDLGYTNYFNIVPDWINTEITLYGEIYQEGGITPNFHIKTKEYGKLTVAATKEQILEGEKKVYRVYGLKAVGKQSIATGKPFDLILEHFIYYNPVFDKVELDFLIDRATPNLSKITDVDAWLKQMRGEINE